MLSYFGALGVRTVKPYFARRTRTDVSRNWEPTPRAAWASCGVDRCCVRRTSRTCRDGQR
eukprot:5340786-Prymnesium_polylepis.2